MGKENNSEGYTVEGLTLIQGRSWTGIVVTALKGANVLIVAVITTERVIIAIQQEACWDAFIYATAGGILIGTIMLELSGRSAITIGASRVALGGIGLIITTALIDIYYVGKAYLSNDPDVFNYYIGAAITSTADVVDMAIAMYVWAGPIPVGAIIEGIAFGISCIFWALGYTNRPYGLVGGIVQIIYWLGGKDPEKIKMTVVNTIGEEWKNARESERMWVLIVRQKWEVPWWLWIVSPFYAAILSAL